jgi:peroxiredoxin
MLKKFLVLFIIALISLPAWAEIGSPPPPFKLPDLNGRTVMLQDHLKKDAVLISFFTSWSKSCAEEISFLQSLSKKYKEKGLTVIGISFDRKAAELRSFASKNKIDFTILQDRKLQMLKDYRILIIPTLFVIDKEGNIKSIYVDFDQNVEKAVSEEIGRLLNPPKT